MSDQKVLQITTISPEETLSLAGKIGAQLKGAEVIELISDLGGGKTTFVKGLAGGLGSPDSVGSPSFTLTNLYHAGKLTLFHFDFYRLDDPGIMQRELAEVLSDKQAIVAIEWPDIIEGILPPEHLSVMIKSSGENRRQVILNYPKKLEYLIQGI